MKHKRTYDESITKLLNHGKNTELAISLLISFYFIFFYSDIYNILKFQTIL